MILGGGDFRLGQTLNKRVPQGGRMMRQISGYDPSLGPLIPEGKPTRVSDYALGGTIPAQVPLAFRDSSGLRIIVRDASENVRVLTVADGTWDDLVSTGDWKAASIGDRIIPQQILCYSHGYTVGDPVIFQEDRHNIVAGALYYVAVVTSGDLFQIAATPGGTPLLLFQQGQAYTYVRSVRTDVFDVIADATPFRLGPLAVFPTKAGLKSYEPDSPTTRSRFFGFKGPQDYDEDYAPVVTPYSPHPQEQLFDIGTTHWEVAYPGEGAAWGGTDFDDLVCGTAVPVNRLVFTFDLGATGVDLTDKQYLMLDLGYSAETEDLIQQTGEFVDSTVRASGFLFCLYSDQACTSLIRSYPIPMPDNTGRISRIAIALYPSTSTVKGLGVKTATYYAIPSHGSHEMFIWSQDFTSSWGHKGNSLLPAVKFSASPWADLLPPIPELTTQHSAAVIETFLGNDVSPDRPRVLWQYTHRGRSALSLDDYTQLIGNPSAESVEYFADPWLVYQLDLTLPLNDDAVPKDMLDEYKDYFTHVLLYRSIYRGYGEDEGLPGELGAWERPEYIVKARIKSAVACTMTVATDLVGAVDHGLELHDVIEFATTANGVTAGTHYYVKAIPDADSFQISAARSGGLLDLTGTDGTNSWSSAAISIDDEAKLDYACTFADGSATITSTVHRLRTGDIVEFTEDTGGVVIATPYFVITTPTANTFTVSTEADGTAFTADETGSNTWNLVGRSLTVDTEYTLPQIMEINHDMPDIARYAVVADDRVYIMHLGYDADLAKWKRPLMGGASNLGDYGSFPITPRISTDENLMAAYRAVDGQELGAFAPDSYEIRGLVLKDTAKFTFTERGFWELAGSDAGTPWVFMRRDSIGSCSAKTEVDARSCFIWHGPSLSYFYAYAGGLARPISKGIVDSSLIDWTEAHQGVFSAERYVFFGYYDDPSETTPWSLWIYDLENDAWHSSFDTCYQFAGMCADEGTADVYGFTYDGDVVSVFGGTESYGSPGAGVYIAEYQHIIMAPPTETRTTELVAADIITEEDSIEMELTVSVQGIGDKIEDALPVTITKDRTQYRWPVSVVGDAVSVALTYEGDHPPEIHYFAPKVPDEVTG